MLKKVYIIGLSILIVLSLAIPSFAAVSPEAPEGATPIAIPWTARYLYRLSSDRSWYSSDQTPTVEDFYGDNGVGDVQIAVVPGVVFRNNTDSYVLNQLMTYHMEYIVTSVPADVVDFYAYSTNPNLFRFVEFYSDIFGNITSSLVSSTGPYSAGSYLPHDIGISDMAISITVLDGSSYKIQFTFSTPLQFNELYQIHGILFPSNGYLSEPGKFVLTDFVAYADPRGTYFDQLQLQATIANMQLLTGILESSTLTNEQLNYVGQELGALNEELDNQSQLLYSQNQMLGEQNQLIEDQNSMLQGDPNDYQDDSGFDDSLDDFSSQEDQINDLIHNDLTLPDGSTLPNDGNAIAGLNSWFKDNYDAQDYEASAGTQISKVFEFFLPYVGIPILINLTLAVILSFLRGRSNA